MYQVLIVEDEPIQLAALQKIIADYNANFSIHTACDYESARTLLSEVPFDLFLLDIKLDKHSLEAPDGIELGKYIRSLKPHQYTPIIFITSLPDKTFDALNSTGCIHYLLKPYTDTEITKCLDNVLHSPLMPEPCFTFQSFWGNRIKIKEADIICFTRNSRRNTEILTTQGVYETNEYTLDQIEKMLTHNFCRCHRQHIINISRVTSYNRSRQELELSDKPIPVGRKYKPSLEDAIRFLI